MQVSSGLILIRPTERMSSYLGMFRRPPHSGCPPSTKGREASLESVVRAEAATDLRLLVSASRSRKIGVAAGRLAVAGDATDSNDKVEESFPDSGADSRSGVEISGLLCSDISRTAPICGVETICGVEAGLAVLL